MEVNFSLASKLLLDIEEQLLGFILIVLGYKFAGNPDHTIDQERVEILVYSGHSLSA